MKRIGFTSLAMMGAALILTGCGGGDKKTTETATVAEKVVVKTMSAATQEVELSEEFTSSIQAFKENNIAPASPGRIDKIYVEVGDNVRQGQVLAKMDATAYNQTKVQLTNLEADFQRIKAVYEVGGISKQEYDQAATQLQVQKDQLSQLGTNTNLVSPITGVVTARNFDAGDVYSGGTPVLQVMQMDRVKVTASISEKYFTDVKLGKEAEIKVDIYPDRVFDGKVSLIYPAIDPDTRTFKVEITIQNPKRELRPGMFSRTSIKFGTEQGIVIEDVAVQKQIGSNEKYVFVVNDGKAQRKLVTTGRQVGDMVHITSGLEVGDQVIVAGISKVMTGTEVTVSDEASIGATSVSNAE